MKITKAYQACNLEKGDIIYNEFGAFEIVSDYAELQEGFDVKEVGEEVTDSEIHFMTLNDFIGLGCEKF